MRRKDNRLAFSFFEERNVFRQCIQSVCVHDQSFFRHVKLLFGPFPWFQNFAISRDLSELHLPISFLARSTRLPRRRRTFGVDGSSYGITSRVRRDTAENTADGIPSTTAPAPAPHRRLRTEQRSACQSLRPCKDKNFSHTLFMCCSRTNWQAVLEYPSPR